MLILWLSNYLYVFSHTQKPITYFGICFFSTLFCSAKNQLQNQGPHNNNKSDGNGNKKKHSTLATHTTCQKSERARKAWKTAKLGGKIPKSMQYFFLVGPSTFWWLVADLAGPT